MKHLRGLYAQTFFTFRTQTFVTFRTTYVHIIQFQLYHSVNIYSEWLQEQFCTLSLYTLYIHALSEIYLLNKRKVSSDLPWEKSLHAGAQLVTQQGTDTAVVWSWLLLTDVNTSLKSVLGTPNVRKLERHEISSSLFHKSFHDIVRSGPVWYHWIEQGWKFVVRSRSEPPSPVPLLRRR